MVFCEDIHRTILSKIYGIENHLNYCLAFNIPLHLDLCKEYKYKGKKGKYITTKYIRNVNLLRKNAMISLVIYEHYVDIFTTTNSLLYVPLNEIINDYDEICNIFIDKCVTLISIDDLEEVYRYIRFGNKLIMNRSLLRYIDDDLRNIFMISKISGYVITDDYNLPDNIGLIKVKFTMTKSNIIRKYMNIKDNEVHLLNNSDIIETLDILWISDSRIMVLKNMPNLRIIFTPCCDRKFTTIDNPNIIIIDMLI